MITNQKLLTQPISQFLPGLIAIVGCVAAMLRVLIGDVIGAAALAVGSVVAAALWTSPAWALYLLAIASFTVDWMTEELALLPVAAAWSVELLILLLFAQAISAQGARGMRLTGLEWPLVLMIGSMLLSAILNGSTLFGLMVGLRGLLRFIVLFYALVNLGFSSRVWQWSMRLLALLMAVQIPVAVWQWAVVGKTDDLVFGTVRSTGVLAVLVIFLLAVLGARFLKEGGQLRFLAAALPFFVLPVIGEVKAFFLFAPAAILMLLRSDLLRRPLRAAVVAGVMGAALFVALSGFDQVEGNVDLIDTIRQPVELREILSASQQADPQGSDAVVALSISAYGRFDSLMDAHRSVRSAGHTTLFGYGPGSRSFTREEVTRQGSSILYASPLATRLYERGYLGVGLYWLILAALVVRTLPLGQSPIPYWRSLRYAFPVIVMVLAAAEAYTEVTIDSIGFTFWFLAAALVTATMALERREARAVVRA